VYNSEYERVFVERKVHNEKWTGDVSSKDRFPIDGSQVMPFLRGQSLHIAEKHNELKHEIQEMIILYRLFPVLRVEYDRIAFQPKDHDHVRVSIDINMRYLQEKTSHLDWYTPENNLKQEDEIIFPYSVVEIKLREPYISNPPQWLNDLEQSSLLHKENNFSKYIHGIYSFHTLRPMMMAKVNGKKGETVAISLVKPSWCNRMEFTSPQYPVESSNESRAKKDKKKKENYQYEGHWFSRLLGIGVVKDQTGAPVKIEPKVFFANERTFLVWFQSSILVSSIGTAILSTGTEAGRSLGYLLLCTGMALIIYAVLTYEQRVNSLLSKRADGYHDRFGPIILAGIITVIFIGSIAIN